MNPDDFFYDRKLCVCSIYSKNLDCYKNYNCCVNLTIIKYSDR